jgi:hypothetical protein
VFGRSAFAGGTGVAAIAAVASVADSAVSGIGRGSIIISAAGGAEGEAGHNQ